MIALQIFLWLIQLFHLSHWYQIPIDHELMKTLILQFKFSSDFMIRKNIYVLNQFVIGNEKGDKDGELLAISLFISLSFFLCVSDRLSLSYLCIPQTVGCWNI